MASEDTAAVSLSEDAILHTSVSPAREHSCFCDSKNGGSHDRRSGNLRILVMHMNFIYIRLVTHD